MPRLQPQRGFHHGNTDEEKEMTAATALASLGDVNSHHGTNHSKIHPHDCSQTTLEMLHREEHEGSESTNSDEEEVVRPTTDVNRLAPSQKPQSHNHYHCDWPAQQVARFSWDFFCSFLVPVLAQFIFGGFSIVRTLVLGYTLQNAVREVLPAFLTTSAEKTIMGGCSSSNTPFHHQGAVPGWLSTPPPALVVLALLTVVAFVIHPDGFTWILLRKLRCVWDFFWNCRSRQDGFGYYDSWIGSTCLPHVSLSSAFTFSLSLSLSLI
jgi:hypothetical protein